MKAEDLTVRQQLIQAGYEAGAVGCRGELHEILAQILAEDPTSNGEFVDGLRSILSAADRFDRKAALEQARAEHQGVKACPECHLKPDLDQLTCSTDETFVSCMNHDGYVVARGGATLSEAIARWNKDDWADSANSRAAFPL